MDKTEVARLANVLKALQYGKLNGMPKYIVESSFEGLSILAEKLIKTGFLDAENKN